MEFNITDKKGFYKVIFDAIKEDLDSKDLLVKDLSKEDTDYILSRGQYYNVKYISEGKEAPVLSEKRLAELCEYLTIKYEPMYKYTFKSTN